MDSSQPGQDLRERVKAALAAQGFSVQEDGRAHAALVNKDQIRAVHSTARTAAIEVARPGLQRHEDRLLASFAQGEEVVPREIRPRLHQIEADSEEELLFRYARLHWSIPVSAGYGRRLRFLVYDESNGKLLGLIGLGDPVFGLGRRDAWVGWSPAQRRERLRHVMDAFVLGAVPPYSKLLCGKFVATLLVSNEVRAAFRRKYRGARSLITSRPFDGRLALVTTSSALGRSSVYNRLTVRGRRVLESVGFTSGSGEFHFANGIYSELLAYARANLEPTAKHSKWGNGWRSRREIVRQSLRHMGLPADLVYHGVQREVFVAPLAANSREFLCGQQVRLRWYGESQEELFERFRERWLLPRADRDRGHREFRRESLRIWDTR